STCPSRCVPRRSRWIPTPAREATGRGGAGLAEHAASALDGRLQPGQPLVPAPGDEVEIAAGRVELPRLQLPETLSPLTPAAREPGLREDTQVLGDRLPREVRAGGESGDRRPPAPAQAGHQPPARLV